MTTDGTEQQVRFKSPEGKYIDTPLSPAQAQQLSPYFKRGCSFVVSRMEMVERPIGVVAGARAPRVLAPAAEREAMALRLRDVLIGNGDLRTATSLSKQTGLSATDIGRALSTFKWDPAVHGGRVIIEGSHRGKHYGWDRMVQQPAAAPNGPASPELAP